MEKFTKGEWFSKDGDGFSREVIITTDDREDCFIIPICEMDMFFDGDVGVEQAANAALIAAAPEMYEMLKVVADELLFMIRKVNSELIQSVTSTTEAEPDYYDEQTVFEIMQLLKKARGEQ